MPLLLFLVQGIFVSIFVFFWRFIEAGLLVILFLVFLTKIIPAVDIFHKPGIFNSDRDNSESLSQSVFYGSWILFYLALIGVSISASEYLRIGGNLELFHYSLFLVSSCIYWIYLFFFPRDKNVFTLLRAHSILSWVFMVAMIISFIIFWIKIPWFMFLNSMMILVGLAGVILLDRYITLRIHLLTVSVFILMSLVSLEGFVMNITSSVSYYFLIWGVWVAFLYIFFIRLLQNIFLIEHQKKVIWYAKNFLLWISWMIAFVLFFYLFLWSEATRSITVLVLIWQLVFWSWVYSTDARNPIFFSGNLLTLCVLYAYVLFRVLPPSFWILLVFLFLFVGAFLFFAQFFRDKPEEIILGISVILFLCIADFVFFFSDFSLFEISFLFLLQSFFWYGSYEIFQRNSYGKNELV